MRFGIRKKLLLLMALLSLALIIVSVLITSTLYTMRMRRQFEADSLNSARTLCNTIRESYLPFLQDYREKLGNIYAEHREEIERFQSSELMSDHAEKERFFNELTKNIFPPKSGFGLSYEMAVFYGDYRGLLQNIDLIGRSSGHETGNIFFYDAEHKNMVYMLDMASDQTMSYHFPGSLATPWDERLASALEKGESAAFFAGDECCSVHPIESDERGEPIAFACFREYVGESKLNTRLFTLYSLGITLAATVVIALFIMLFADRLIVKNVRRLSDAAERFTSNLKGSRPVKVSAGIRSGDEIGALSEKMDIMQDAIIGYIGSLEEKTAAEERMKTELELAARIQSEALPQGGMTAGAYTVESFLKPAREVGGDFFDFFMLDEKRLFFCLSDVSGKGIPAALFMMRTKELIKSGIRSGKPLADFAAELNQSLCRGNTESVFITAFFGILDTESGILKYLRAGHEQPMLKRGESVLTIGEESNYVLGALDDVEFVSDEMRLESGDTLLMYTDGVNEGINESAEEFGYERISEALLSAREDVTGEVYAALKRFCGGAEQFDDVTMLVLKASPPLRMELKKPVYDDITAVTDAVFARLCGFDTDDVSKIGILIDEIMNNQISYAFKDVSEPVLAVKLDLIGDTARLAFEDNGKGFDPLSEVTDEDLENSDGGFGLEFVRSFSDRQRYERVNGLNRLTVEKRLHPKNG